MLLDFETTLLLVGVLITLIASIIVLVHTNVQ
jgi:hypothetical protein